MKHSLTETRVNIGAEMCQFLERNICQGASVEKCRVPYFHGFAPDSYETSQLH